MPATVLCEKCRATLSIHDFSEPSDFTRQRLRFLYAPPNSVETYKIISWVSEADQDLGKLDEEIQRSRDTLRSLEKQHEELKRCREETQSLLSPVRRLPMEVLEQVFGLACFSDSTCLSPSTYDYALDITINTAGAWTLDLSQVCSVWRQIIRSRPSLWSSLWIDLSHRNRAFEVMKHYLEQSQRAPLTLFITAGSLDQESMGDDDMARSVSSAVEDTYEDLPLQLRDYSWEVLELLFSFSERWKDVTMRLSWDVFTEISLTFDLRNINLEQLTALNLDWRYTASARESDSFMLSFAHLPRLRCLSLTEFEPWFNLPLHSITTLGSMRGWTASGVVHALTECGNVDSFTIESEHFDLEVSPPIETNARSLDITDHNDDVRLGRFLNLLTATQLENLTCKGVLKDEGWQTSLRNFISRSQCPLKTLTLHCEYTGGLLLQLLSLLPTLTNLTLRCASSTPVDVSVFDELITTMGSSSIVPRLQQLDLFCCAFKTETQPLLLISHVLTMAELRSKSSSRVESLNAVRLYIAPVYDSEVSRRNGCNLDSESLLRLQHLNEGGMKVSIILGPSHL